VTSIERRCVLCGAEDPNALVSLATTDRQLSEWIASKTASRFGGGDRICRPCLNHERITHSIERLEQERGELTVIESQIAMHAASHLAIAQNAQAAFEQRKTLGDRVSDRVAAIGGSWTFLIGFFVVLVGWVVINVAMVRAFDPYPFILLNLVLSTLAAVQAQEQVLLDANQALQRAGDRWEKMEGPARAAFIDAAQAKELRVFLYRLALTLPLLVLAGWLFAKKRKSTWWPFVWGFIYFALFAFFVELVPYLPGQCVCPGCERPVDLKDTSVDFCPHCGIGLFDRCGC